MLLAKTLVKKVKMSNSIVVIDKFMTKHVKSPLFPSSFKENQLKNLKNQKKLRTNYFSARFSGNAHFSRISAYI